MIERPTIFKELMSASILLAVVTSILYLSGISYIDSYLTQWGVESNLITSNPQEVLIQGASIWIVAGFTVVILAVFIGVLFLFQFYMVSEISKAPLVRKFASKIYEIFKNKKTVEPEPPVIIQWVIRLLLRFVVLCMFLSCLLFALYMLLNFSSSQGRERAEKEYIEFSSGNFSDSRLFSRKKILTIDGVKKEGYILTSSDSMVVLYLLPENSKDEQVVIIPLNSISEIKAKKNAT